MPKRWTLINLIGLSLLLTACGWQLRNAQLLPDSIGSVYLSSKQSHSSLVKELSQAIDQFGVQVASSSSQAEQSFMIVDYKQSRRISTLNSSARVAEYQLDERVDYLILDSNGKPLAPLATASAQKTYEFDENDILGSTNEQQRVKQRLHEAIARQMLTHLNAVANR